MKMVTLKRNRRSGFWLLFLLVALFLSIPLRFSAAAPLFQDTPYPGPATATLQPTGEIPAYPGPATATQPALPPTVTQSPAATDLLGRTTTPTQTGVVGTPTPTTTLAPFPTITLLFPAISPTPTASRTAAVEPETAAWAIPGPRDGISPQVGFMGGLIVTIWLLLGTFLIVYLRRIGY